MSNNPIIPHEVETSFFPEGAVDVRRLGGGIINITLLVDNVEGKKLVLQRLSPIFSAEMNSDYQVVADHLQNEGWEMPSLVKTSSGALDETDDSGNVWRAFEFIDSDAGDIDPVRLDSLSIYGAMLGKLHVSLAKLDYRPSFALPHFHDTEYYAGVLDQTVANLPSDNAQGFATELLSTYRAMPPLPETNKQLIHGDPRTGNILHRDGVPFTFIDWDTLMHGTIWMDIGDMLRSLSENAVMANQPVPVKTLLDVAEGYRQAARPDSDPKEFQTASLMAAQRITVELAMRFTADYKEGEKGYFSWDETQYPTRHAHNMNRAHKQWEIFTQLQKYNDTQGAMA